MAGAFCYAQGMPSNIVPDHNYGVSADYSAWEANTEIVLCNVPWNNDYRDIVKWDNRAALDNYIQRLPATITKTTTYARINAPIKLDTPFALANKYNYARVYNPRSPLSHDEPTYFYYFITDVGYSAAETSVIRVQLDLWSTFGDSVTFGRSFIERGHIGIANQFRMDSFGRRYLTEPEGLDTGSDYQTTNVAKNRLMDTRGTGTGTNSDRPMVMVLSATQLDGTEHGDIDNPRVVMATPWGHAGVPMGLGLYMFRNIDDYRDMIRYHAGRPWVIEGIKSVTIIPNVARYGLTTVSTGGSGDRPGFVYMGDVSQRPNSRRTSLWNNWREGFRNVYIPARYRHLDKFLTYPYLAVEATTWNGSNIVMRPELWADEDATMIERVGLIPPAQRVTFSPLKYNAATAFIDSDGDDYGDHLSMSVTIDQFPVVPVMNDAATLALAQNARGMAFERRQADWSQTLAERGIAASYDVATNAMATSTQQTDLNNRSNRQTTDFNNQFRALGAAAGAAQGIATGGAMGMIGGPAGAVAGAAGGAMSGGVGMMNAAMSAHQASGLTSMSNATASESNRISNQSSAFVRDTNRDLSAYAARGDYAMAIAGQQARIQDTLMTQPSILGGFGGDSFRLINNFMELNLRWKRIDPAAMARIGEFWLKYGYAINRFAPIPASLMVMDKFTYWKLSDTYVKTADMPEAYKQAIRGIFEKGVTVWKNPADIGNIDFADNRPLEGVSY